MEGRSIQSKLYKLCCLAREKKKGDKQQAARLYKKAIEEFNLSYDDYESLYRAKIQLAELYRTMKKFSWSTQMFKEVIESLKDDDIKDKGLNQEAIDQLNYQIHHNLGRLFIERAVDISKNVQTKVESYDDYRRFMNASFNYFQKSQKIIQRQILSDLSQQKRIEESRSTQFLKFKSNYLQLLFQEAEQFKIQQQYRNLISEIDKAEMFYNLIIMNKEKQKKVTKSQKHIYRCKYFKAISLRQIGQIKQCLELLLKVYAFQKSVDELSDAEKSRTQILRASLDLHDIKKALKHVISNEQTSIIRKIQQRRSTTLKFFTKNIQDLLKYTTQDYTKMFVDFDELNDQYIYDYEMMDTNLTRLVDIYKNNNQIRGLLYYYLAQCNLRLHRFERANRYIEECLKVPSNDQFERRDRRIQEFLILCRMMQEQTRIVNMYKKLEDQISKLVSNPRYKEKVGILLSQKDNLDEAYNHYKVNKKKSNQSNKIYDFSTPEEGKILHQLTSIKQKRLKKLQNSRPNDEYQRINQPKNDPIKYYSTKQITNITKPKETTYDQYIKRCKQFQFIERQQFKKLLNNDNLEFNPLVEMINLSLKELEFIFKYMKVDKIDLRKHALSKHVLEVIRNYFNLSQIKCLCLNGFNQVPFSSVYQIFRKSPNLHFIAFYNFCEKQLPYSNRSENIQRMDIQSQNQIPKSLTQLISLLAIPSSPFNIQIIKRLKLKYCNLTDQHLNQMQIRNFVNLEELSLSHNHLKGYSLADVMNLRDLAVINISDNPMETFDFNGWKKRLFEENYSIRKLKLKAINFNNQNLREQLSFFIQNITQIDLSQSSGLSDLINLLIGKIIEGKIQLNKLQKLLMKDSNLQDVIVYNFVIFLTKCPVLSYLDIRFCSYTTNMREIITNASELSAIVIKMSKFHDSKMTSSNFSLTMNPEKR